MNIKQFLKPDWKKIAILVFLIAASLLYQSGFALGELPATARGFPLSIIIFSPEDSSYAISTVPSGIPLGISYEGLILDLLFWYFISCLIIWSYDKLKRKSS